MSHADIFIQDGSCGLQSHMVHQRGEQGHNIRSQRDATPDGRYGSPDWVAYVSDHLIYFFIPPTGHSYPEETTQLISRLNI